MGETFSSTDSFLSCRPKSQKQKSICAALALPVAGQELFGGRTLILGHFRTKGVLKFIVTTARLAFNRRGDSEHVS